MNKLSLFYLLQDVLLKFLWLSGKPDSFEDFSFCVWNPFLLLGEKVEDDIGDQLSTVLSAEVQIGRTFELLRRTRSTLTCRCTLIEGTQRPFLRRHGREITEFSIRKIEFPNQKKLLSCRETNFFSKYKVNKTIEIYRHYINR